MGRQEGRSFYDRLERMWNQLIVSIFEYLGKFGFPGIVIMLIFIFVRNSATDEQKREMVDMYILWKGGGKDFKNLIGISIFGGILMVGMQAFYRRRLRLKDERIKKLGQEKSKLQQKLLKVNLSSSKVKGRKK